MDNMSEIIRLGYDSFMEYIVEYDKSNPLSIEAYAQRLVGKTFRQVCDDDTVSISDDGKYGTAEVDSFLFEDLYEAKLDGKSISITDGREVKEPKLREGDSVVIYGVGDGYNTQYSYEKGLILGLPKNIESEKIPNIKMLYVAF